MLLQLFWSSIFSFKMNLSQKIFVYTKIIRPINVVITFFVVVVAILISQKNQTEISLIILASLAAALTTAAGNIINDIYDIETDKISHPKRVLALGLLSPKEARYEYFVFNLLSAFISIYISITLFVIVFISSFLLFVYSFYLKRIPLVGNLVIALITGLAFIYGGFTADNPNAGIIPAIFASLINLIREIIKDIQDVEGDAKQGIQTFPIKYGISLSKRLVAFFTIILIAFTLYPFVKEIYKIEYFIIAMIFVNPILVLSLKFLFGSRENSFNTISKLLKLDMALGLIAIYFGN
jgi:geranylgeranylglycerol-phosphate geranylgeranyltransferase